MRNPSPLQWPDGWPRTPADKRQDSKFHVKRKASPADPHAMRYELPVTPTYLELVTELGRLGAANYVITSDLPLNSKGVPYANARAGHDPGIAVYFTMPDANGNLQERVMPCDRWKTPADNMYALALTIAAMRGIDRWGAADIVNRAFSGFTALPPGSGETVNARPAPPKKRHWREVLLGERSAAFATLTNDELRAIVKIKYRQLMEVVHPDRGGADERAAECNQALEDAERELGGA